MSGLKINWEEIPTGYEQLRLEYDKSEDLRLQFFGERDLNFQGKTKHTIEFKVSFRNGTQIIKPLILSCTSRLAYALKPYLEKYQRRAFEVRITKKGDSTTPLDVEYIIEDILIKGDEVILK